MKKAEVTEERWHIHLEMLLTGRALKALTHNVPTESRENYQATNESSLNAMVLTIIDHGRSSAEMFNSISRGC